MNTPFKNIAVVDDHPENREAAAVALREIMPDVTVVTFQGAVEVIKALVEGTPEIDLVISDMKMEDKHSGLRVAREAWSWGIPATIVSGGHKTHTTDEVHVGYPSGQFRGEKSDPAVWKQIIKHILKGDRLNNGLYTAKAAGGRRKTPDYEFGDTCAIVAVPLSAFGS